MVLGILEHLPYQQILKSLIVCLNVICASASYNLHHASLEEGCQSFQHDHWIMSTLVLNMTYFFKLPQKNILKADCYSFMLILA